MWYVLRAKDKYAAEIHIGFGELPRRKDEQKMTYNILEYGAVADRKTNCSAALQQAIDACSAAGGGTVLIPVGEYLIGSVTLKSHVHLHFELGAVLYASRDPADYVILNPQEVTLRGRLFYAENETDIFIDGQGTIYGTGEADYGSWWGLGDPLPFRTNTMYLKKCENVRIEQITIRYSDNWTLHLLQCENVWIRGIRIMNNMYHLNSDGIDPDSCKNVFISDCYVQAGDDCICPKASVPGVPNENLVVTNCVLETTTTAIKLGTDTHGNFTDMHFSNITIRNTSIGIGMYMKDGAVIERITFNNISIQCADDRAHIKAIHPIFLDIDKRRPETPVGKIRDVSFNNIMAVSSNPSLIQGFSEEHPIENLTFSNVVLRVPDICDLAHRTKQLGYPIPPDRDASRDIIFIRKNAYFSIAYTRNLTLDNITVIREEPALAMDMNPIYLYDSPDANISRIKMR